MKVSKQFRWEAAHRLPWHEGSCSNLHGHSYRMRVEMVGEPDDRGMIVDFRDIKRVLKPLVDRWDHATLVARTDTDLLAAVEALDSKYYVLPDDTTAENLCTYAADFIMSEAPEFLDMHGITRLRIRLYETDTCYAEGSWEVPRPVDDRSGRAAVNADSST